MIYARNLYFLSDLKNTVSKRLQKPEKSRSNTTPILFQEKIYFKRNILNKTFTHKKYLRTEMYFIFQQKNQLLGHYY